MRSVREYHCTDYVRTSRNLGLDISFDIGFAPLFVSMNIACVFYCCIYTHGAPQHYGDVIMGAIASQITSLTIAYSTVYSDADQRKHQSSASLAFVWGIQRWPVNSPHNGPVSRKMFPFDDVIMKIMHMFRTPKILLMCGTVDKSRKIWVHISHNSKGNTQYNHNKTSDNVKQNRIPSNL